MVVLQHRNFGLGNFINCTPTIWAHYLATGDKPKVYFESQYVRDCFDDRLMCVDILELPVENYDLSSEWINFDVPDYKYINRKAGFETKYMTYPPLWMNKQSNRRLAVVLNGCANPDKDHTKKMTPEFMDAVISELSGYEVVRYGNIGEDMVKATQDIYDAQIVVGNDTGLSHFAAMLGKKQIIFWKDTNFIKNMNLNPNCTYSKTNWMADFKKWLC